MIESVVYENRQRGFTTIKIRCTVCCANAGTVVLRMPVCGEDEEKGLQRAWDKWNMRADNGL